MKPINNICYLLQYKEPSHDKPTYFLVKPNGDKVCDLSSSSIERLAEMYEGISVSGSKITSDVPEFVIEMVKQKYAAPKYITRVNGKAKP